MAKIFWPSWKAAVNPLWSIWSSAPKAVAGEIDAVCVVNDAVEDGVSECRLAEHGAMPQ